MVIFFSVYCVILRQSDLQAGVHKQANPSGDTQCCNVGPFREETMHGLPRFTSRDLQLTPNASWESGSQR